MLNTRAAAIKADRQMCDKSGVVPRCSQLKTRRDELERIAGLYPIVEGAARLGGDRLDTGAVLFYPRRR